VFHPFVLPSQAERTVTSRTSFGLPVPVSNNSSHVEYVGRHNSSVGIATGSAIGVRFSVEVRFLFPLYE
jgi:hypothetical protein